MCAHHPLDRSPDAGRGNHLYCARRIALAVAMAVMAGCQMLPAGPAPSPTPELATTPTPRSTATAVRTPPSLPRPFQSKLLNPLDTVHTYEDNACVYLRNKWDPDKAAPGTVVMIVMLHSINRRKAEGPEALTALLFARMMDDIHETRFQAISMEQLVGFLEENAKIPYRSVLLIQDQTRYPDNFDKHFGPYWDMWEWPVVSAWDQQSTLNEETWAGYQRLSQQGRVDFQVYGPTFKTSGNSVSEDYLTRHLQEPIDVLEERLHKKPLAVIWPSGFSAQSAGIARALGYRVGFTFNPRGPVMYNWIPLSETFDKFRPSHLPEAEVGDPLMTLPRYWPHQVHDALDGIRAAGDGAAAYAARNKSTELRYYEIVCAGQYGPISSLLTPTAAGIASPTDGGASN